MSGWYGFQKSADPAAPAAPAAPATQPLQRLDQDRQPPPPNPTGIPDQKPMPLSELARLLELSGKAILDAGLDLEKSSAALQKVKTMGGASESERAIMAKSEGFAQKISSLKQDVSRLADEISGYRESLVTRAPAAGSKGWWTKK